MREWKKHIYLFSIFFTIVALLLSFSLAYVYYQVVISPHISSHISDTSADTLTILTMKLLEENKSDFCLFYNQSQPQLDAETWKIGGEVDEATGNSYEDKTLINKYVELEMRDYLLSKDAAKLCGLKQVLILYFFSPSDIQCPFCQRQGELLSAIRQSFNKNQTIHVKIYSFNGNLNLPVIEYFKKKYHITSYPTIIVNGHKYVGFKNFNQLKQIVQNMSNTSTTKQ